MPKGKVKWFDAQKGYGFIEQEQGSDLFVHHSEVQSESLSGSTAYECRETIQSEEPA